jgi:hypothetical protein
MMDAEKTIIRGKRDERWDPTMSIEKVPLVDPALGGCAVVIRNNPRHSPVSMGVYTSRQFW